MIYNSTLGFDIYPMKLNNNNIFLFVKKYNTERYYTVCNTFKKKQFETMKVIYKYGIVNN